MIAMPANTLPGCFLELAAAAAAEAGYPKFRPDARREELFDLRARTGVRTTEPATSFDHQDR
jgi:hypothetical protein